MFESFDYEAANATPRSEHENVNKADIETTEIQLDATNAVRAEHTETIEKVSLSPAQAPLDIFIFRFRKCRRHVRNAKRSRREKLHPSAHRQAVGSTFSLVIARF